MQQIATHCNTLRNTATANPASRSAAFKSLCVVISSNCLLSLDEMNPMLLSASNLEVSRVTYRYVMSHTHDCLECLESRGEVNPMLRSASNLEISYVTYESLPTVPGWDEPDTALCFKSRGESCHLWMCRVIYELVISHMHGYLESRGEMHPTLLFGSNSDVTCSYVWHGAWLFLESHGSYLIRAMTYSYPLAGHFTRTNVSYYTYKWVMSHVWMCPVTSFHT